MTARMFVCIECHGDDNSKGCTIIPRDIETLPTLCGFDKVCKPRLPNWMEVPEKKILKSIFPFE